MSYLALNSSANGMSALNTQLDVIANNIANADTPAFKSSRTDFQDLYYIEKKQPGVENLATQSTSPVGLFVGLGVEVAGTQLDLTQGAPIPGGQLDVMIDGKGFFQVDMGDLSPSGIGYTRNGQFKLNADGELVVGPDVGYRLEPSIEIPPSGSNVTITSDGSVYYDDPQNAEPVLAGRLQLAVFQNPAGMKQFGQNIMLETFASGPPNEGDPGDPSIGAGGIQSGVYEGSNVDAVTELVDLIRTQRAFEMNSQSFNAADETLQTIVNLGR